jgi:adenine-specific DNA-methyltransferase
MKTVETFVHEDEKRKNIPTAEMEPLVRDEQKKTIQVAYERRNRDLDPQLVWRGKDEQGQSDLKVPAPPLYIQEKVHPKVLIDDLKRLSEETKDKNEVQPDLFSDFNGIVNEEAKTEFYQHEQNWSNRMILGDSLNVMSSLAEREGLRGKVQCIYIDPPYGIKFNSNFQWSTTSRDVKDGKQEHITREPEMVKAFRDTWRDGIHSYLTYLRDRLIVSRDLLTESGSVFVQIGDENVHRVRALMDEVFGEANFVSQICFRKKFMSLGAEHLDSMFDYILFYAKNKKSLKYRTLFSIMNVEGDKHWNYIEMENKNRRKISTEEVINHKLLPAKARIYQLSSLYPAGFNASGVFEVELSGKKFKPPFGKSWKTSAKGVSRLIQANRIEPYVDGKTLRHVLFLNDYPVSPIENVWTQMPPPTGKIYVVQTSVEVVKRCILMSTDPGDLVIDPTCGSGTTSYVAEQWGRRWITIDTSRVALTLTRNRIMGARYKYYLLKDSRKGQLKESEISLSVPSENQTYGNIRQGFVYNRLPHITLKSIANNLEIDVICDKYQEILEPIRKQLNQALGESWEEWEIPREVNSAWPSDAKVSHGQWWEQKIMRQREIDASIAAKASYEYLYDKPYENKSKVRVAGPFTMESISPHRVLGVDEEDELIDVNLADNKLGYEMDIDFGAMILENLKTAGVQQSHKEDKINFTSLTAWPGNYICAEGLYTESDTDNAPVRRAGVFIGPEFGTVQRTDLVSAAREAADAGFDVLISCAFSYEAHATEFNNLGKVPVLKATMNADMHMSDELKNTGKGNLFVIFGEPDIDIIDLEDEQIQIKINGVDVFHPQTGEIRSDNSDGIACWFIDSDYNEESFFVRQAYFLGANDPYKSLKTTLKAEINKEAWDTLNSDISRPFPKPNSGRIAVKVINHLGDEVMKVFKVD